MAKALVMEGSVSGLYGDVKKRFVLGCVILRPGFLFFAEASSRNLRQSFLSIPVVGAPVDSQAVVVHFGAPQHLWQVLAVDYVLHLS